jgi:hypothetical protein
MMTSVRPDQERLFEDLGLAGAGARGLLAVLTQAAGANKIDYFPDGSSTTG